RGTGLSTLISTLTCSYFPISTHPTSTHSPLSLHDALPIFTGRGSAALRRRCKELDIEFVYEKQGHKVAAYEDVLRKTGAQESEVGRKSTRLNSSHEWISYAVFCLKKKINNLTRF